MSDTESVPRLSGEELQQLFLFEALEDDQLAWLSEHGRVEQREQGNPVYSEGEPATCYFVLLSGTISMHRRVEDTDVEINRTNQVGVYAGATQAFLRNEDPVYLNTVLAVTDCRFWVIEADSFGAKIREWFPMAMHLLEGMTLGMRTSQAAVGQRERLLSLGRLSAGLTHELNNPAAAAVRATASLRERVSRMRGKLAHLAGGEIDGQAFKALLEVQEAAIERMAKVEEMTTVEVADAEDAAADWLDEHGVADGWDLAPALVAAGVDPDWLDEVAAKVPDELLGDGIKWVAYALETEQLMSEIEDSTLRISTLVGAAKQYSQLDRAAHADIDVKEGLISTIIMLKHKMKAGPPIELVKDFATDLPLGPGPSGRAQPGLDEPDRQRAAGDAGRRHPSHHRPRWTATVCWWRSATPGPVSRPSCGTRSSSRSSPPSRWARAPDSDWTSATASSPNATAATCG